MKLLKFIVRHFVKSVVYDNQGIGWFVPALISGASSLLGGALNKNKKVNTNDPYFKSPEYPEAEEARKLWWEKLQGWGKDPNYGAISPDWGNIWQTAQDRVKRFYEGGPLSPGLVDKARSNLARRNMSENPASDLLLSRIGAQEGNELRELATDQATKQAEFGERGRMSWLDSLSGLSNMRQGVISNPMYGQRTQGLGDLVSSFGNAFSSGLSNKMQYDWLSELFKKGA